MPKGIDVSIYDPQRTDDLLRLHLTGDAKADDLALQLRACSDALTESEAARNEAHDEIEACIEMMTPEQIDAYLVRHGYDLDVIRAHAQDLRARIEAMQTKE
jgi:hypothetical protein